MIKISQSVLFRLNGVESKLGNGRWGKKLKQRGRENIKKGKEKGRKMHKNGVNEPCDAKFSKKCLFSPHDKTALIKQIQFEKNGIK